MDPSVHSSEGIKFGSKMETLAHIFRRQLNNEEGRLGLQDMPKGPGEAVGHLPYEFV